MSIIKKIHLADGEEVLEIVRRYPLTRWWLYALGMAILSATAFFTFWLFAHGWWGYTLFGLGLMTGAYSFVFVHFFERSNCLVITNFRAVDVSRTSWFDETISSVGYLDLKEALVSRHGIFSNIFNYGMVSLVARDKQFVLEIERVRAPGRVHALLLEAKESFKERRRFQNDKATFSGFLELIPELTEAESLLVEKRIKDRLAKIYSPAPKLAGPK